jgi:GTP-binding protein EngB required for normal cell division
MSENSKDIKRKTDDGGLLWHMLRKFVNLIDELRDLGLQEHINLPRIAVLGAQSSGKSSVLESIVGLDFLPRGDGIVTRRPLELRLHHLQENTEPWAVFEEVKGKKFKDFIEVRKTIEELTDKTAGINKNIIDEPIVLAIYSYTCPDLTLIDLPGITRIPLKGSGQPENIERITTEMAKRYCGDERTIILCVIPANIDLTTSEALKYAQEWDKHQVRTLGVITKLDIMDQGTNAKATLMNQVVFLKLGYVGVKNRSQKDIIDKMRVQSGLDIERSWFMDHPVYRSLPKDCYGTDSLVHKLSRIMYAHIRTSLPDIMKEIEEKLKSIDERLKDLGPSLPTTEGQKVQMLWAMINDFNNSFGNRITGKLDIKSMKQKMTLTGGAKIKASFFELYKDCGSPEYRVSDNFTDKDIERAIILHEGDKLSGFPSIDVFYYLIQPEISKLKEPATTCLLDVYYYLEELAHTILEKSFVRFPAIIPELMAAIQQILSEERDKAKYIVESIIDSEIGYMFTNDADYNGKRTDIIPKGDFTDKTADSTKVYVKEMRARMDSYFRLVVRSIRDSVPKVIGSFLVRAAEDHMQLELNACLSQNEQINALLSEPLSVAEERQRLAETREVLRKSLKAMQRDPEYSYISS